MASNFEGLNNIIPNIGTLSPIGQILRAEGMTKEGVFSVFGNAEELFNTPFWAKFIEKYTMESPIKALFGGLEVGFIPELRNILPGIAKGISGRSQ